MAKQPSKVASWYWIISAILTPFVLLATVFWAYYAFQSQNYRAEATSMLQKLDSDAKQFDDMVAHMKEVSAATGFNMADPLKSREAMQSQVTIPTGIAEQDQKPVEDRNPIYNTVREAEKHFYGEAAGTPGYLPAYMAARDYLGEFEKNLKHYLALKSYQYYAVRTINVEGQAALVAGGDLKRSVQSAPDGYFYPSDTDVEAAFAKFTANTPPSDQTLLPPTRITMELVLRKQAQLIGELVAANQHQYNLLYAEVTGKEGDFFVGYQNEESQRDSVTKKIGELNTLVAGRRDISVSRLTEAFDSAELALTETKAKKSRYELLTLAADSRISGLADRFEAERAAHEHDQQEFEKLTRSLPRIKSPIKIEKRESDGEVTYSDYARRVVHINLGRADGVKTGQRFEVWRLHGRDRDLAVGVVEIIRCLSDHFSLCTVLSLTDESEPVRKSDKIVSRIWHKGKFMTVALHGSFEPPNQAYSKDRLTALLKQAGCRVVEKVQPGTDIVILGSNLLGDEWYRKARDDIRFETLKEEEVRIYVDPR